MRMARYTKSELQSMLDDVHVAINSIQVVLRDMESSLSAISAEDEGSQRKSADIVSVADWKTW